MNDRVLVLALFALSGQLDPRGHTWVIVAVAVSSWLLGVTRGTLALAGMIFALFSALARHATTSYEGDLAALSSQHGFPTRCGGILRIAGSPTLRGEVLRFVSELEEVSCESGPLSARVRVTLDAREIEGPARGDRLRFVGSFAPVERFANEGSLDGHLLAAQKGVLLSGHLLHAEVETRGKGLTSWIDRARAHARARIVTTFPLHTEAMARALVLGETDLAEEDDRAVRDSGLSHLLAVSGMHLILVVGTLREGTRRLLSFMGGASGCMLADRVAAAIALPFTWVYEDFAGGSGSALRAAVMMSFLLVSRVLGLRKAPSRAFALSLWVMALSSPLRMYDFSFLLSVLSTGGLLVLLPRLEVWTRGRLSLLSPTLAATASCAPATLVLSPELSLGGLVSNLAAVPLGEALALPFCMLHMLAAPFPFLERALASSAAGALEAVRAVAHLTAFPSWLRVSLPTPTGSELALAAICFTWVATRPFCLRVGALFAAALLGLEGLARHVGQGAGTLRLTVLDVGQGDALLVDFPTGEALLVDGGGLVGSPVDTGARALLPLLRARRRNTLEFVALSHPHPDHFLGLRAVVRAVPLGEFWASLPPPTLGLGSVPVRGPEALCGSRRVGAVIVEVLSPCPGPQPAWGANDNSLVIRLRYGWISFLLTGDIEEASEQALVLRFGGGLSADVLKVGHHGSRTSSTEPFLNAVRPRWAAISSGVRNRFGHPHPVTLRKLEARSVSTLRTDTLGAVTFETDGLSLATNTQLVPAESATERRP